MNTGVYVVDLFYWIKHNITEQLERWYAHGKCVSRASLPCWKWPEAEVILFLFVFRVTLNTESKGDLFDHQREIGYAGL